jgi:sRNA-binding protein
MKGTIEMLLHRTLLPRWEIEDLIKELSFSYPKCFFTDPYQKRPLKKNIILDLQNDSMKERLDDERLNSVLAFYMRDWNYEYKLLAGAKRIDLDGNEVGTVTETEAREARERVRVARAERKAREEMAVKQQEKNIRVVTLPSQPAVPPPVPTPVPTTTPEPMARLSKLMGNIERINTGTADPVLRDALTVAALQVLITEATRFVESRKPTN